MILNSPTISGSLTVTGNIITSGSITLSGSVASASYADTASFVALAQSASNAVSAATASFANAFTVAGTLTAQTLVVQTITSSVDFVTGSTRFGSSLSTSTHQFTGSVSVTGSSTFTAGVTPLTVKGTNAGTMYTEYYYNTSTLVGSIGNGSGLLSGANASDFIIRSEADYVVATGGNNRRMTISSAETTLNFNPQSGSLLSGYNYLNFGGGSIMYRNMTDLYIGSNAKYGSAGTTVACYTSANGMGMLTMDGGTFNFQATTGSVTANTAYGMPIRMTITSAGNVGIGTSSPNGNLEVYAATPIIISGASSSGTLHGLEFRQSNTIDAYIKQLPATGEFRFYVGRNSSWGGNMSFWTDTVQRMTITSGGAVSISNNLIVAGGGGNGVISIGDTTTSSTGIYINTQTFSHRFVRFAFQGNPMGEIYYNGTNTSYAASGSDIRLKKNIQNWDENILDLFKDINPKTFNWNFQEDTDTKSKGFIAQEMTNKFPEAYHKGDNDFYLYNPSGMVVYLTKAIQELKTQHDALQSRIETLESK